MSVLSKYERVRRSLVKRLWSLRKKGYEVDVVIPPKPKKITPGSIRKLEKIRKQIPEKTSYKGHTGFGAYRARKADLQEKRKRQELPEPEQTPETKGYEADVPIDEETPTEEPVEPEEEVPPEPETETDEETPSETEPEEEPESYDLWGEEVDEEDWFDVSAGEIVYEHLLDLIGQGQESDKKNVRQGADYCEEVLNDAIERNGFNETMKNLANTQPENINEATSIIFDSTGDALEREKETGYFLYMVKFGEMLTEEEARAATRDSFPDEGENWEVDYHNYADDYDGLPF